MRPKIDVFLIVDHSLSTMNIIDTINRAIKKMLEELRFSPYLSGVDKYLTIIQYNHHSEAIVETTLVENVDPGKINLTSAGATDTGSAILKALNIGSRRYQYWREEGEESWHPLYFLFTDGYPDAGQEASREEEIAVERAYTEAAMEIKRLENSGKLLFVAGGFCSRKSRNGANMDKLRELTNYDKHVIEIPDDKIDKLSKFFSDIIPITVIHTVTSSKAQLEDAFLS